MNIKDLSDNCAVENLIWDSVWEPVRYLTKKSMKYSIYKFLGSTYSFGLINDLSDILSDYEY